ncbi:hypothetical protein TNCV_1299881 [Trichonephila clavipes]|nr:hypothetical protein TNCV_1299881 [Trichonephila clavipes]
MGNFFGSSATLWKQKAAPSNAYIREPVTNPLGLREHLTLESSIVGFVKKRRRRPKLPLLCRRYLANKADGPWSLGLCCGV